MSRTKSSKRWLERHFSDHYVRQAQAQGLASRAAFKLEEFQQRDKIIRNGMIVVDLGAAPGSWSQFAANIVGATGRVIALDLLPIRVSNGIEFIQGDFQDAAILTQLLSIIGSKRVGLILSDMSPNLSGIASIDQPKSLYLAELTYEFAKQILDQQGTLLIKVFQGEGFDNFIKQLRHSFKKVIFRKPAASRSESREIYVLAKQFIV